jgi:hypothetical protein
MALSFPTSPSSGDVFTAQNGFAYVYDGDSWTTLGSAVDPNPFTANPFKFRSVYTRGYVTGGYKSSSPWKNTNRTVHATDTTANLGDTIGTPAAYTMGSYSDYHQYVYQCSTAFPGTGTRTESVNMTTEAARTHNSDWDTSSAYTGYSDIGVLLAPGLTLAYLTGKGYRSCRHNLVSEVMADIGTFPSIDAQDTSGSDFQTAWQGKTYGWIKSTHTGSLNLKFLFSTETFSAGGLSVGTDGWGKALSTKEGHAYVKNTGNIGNTVYKINDETGSNISTTLTTPDGNAGEENYQTGQEHGYCLGHYNGVQNNNTYKVVHETDTFTTLGSTAQPKGHDGMSSAACASASAYLLGGD